MLCSQNASRKPWATSLVAVVAEERPVGEVAVELGAVGGLAGADLVEDLDRQALGVVVGAQHQRRDGGDQHELGDAVAAVPADVVDDLAAAGGVPDQGEVASGRGSSIRQARSSA